MQLPAHPRSSSVLLKPFARGSFVEKAGITYCDGLLKYHNLSFPPKPSVFFAHKKVTSAYHFIENKTLCDTPFVKLAL